jgi:ATP-binding cassette subfamily B protein
MTTSTGRPATPPKRGMMGGHGPRGGGPMAMMPGEKQKISSRVCVILLSYLGTYKTGIVFVMLLAMLSTLFTIVGPKILQKPHRIIPWACQYDRGRKRH